MRAGAIDDVPRKRPMDVPAVVVVAQLMEMLDVPGECVLRVAVMGQHLVRVDPRDRSASKDDRQRCADEPRASAAFLEFCSAVLGHESARCNERRSEDNDYLHENSIISAPSGLVHSSHC